VGRFPYLFRFDHPTPVTTRSIENHLHWHLDVTFNEDANRSRSGNAPQNLNILRKMALHRISNMDDKLSLKKRRFRASMNVDYLREVVGI
jgi:hypothetical protein